MAIIRIEITVPGDAIYGSEHPNQECLNLSDSCMVALLLIRLARNFEVDRYGKHPVRDGVPYGTCQIFNDHELEGD